MKTKKCSKCNTNKPLTEFSKAKTGSFGLRLDCKKCRSLYNKTNYLKNKNKIQKRRKINSSLIKEKARDYYLKNKEHLLKNHRDYYKKNYKKINKKNVESVKTRYKNDPKFKLTGSIRDKLVKLVKGKEKSGSAKELLGCSVEYLKKHLESKFVEGMSWDNHGVHGWHIDHIIPCASFDLSKPDQQRKCFHFTNLQPLWAKDNLRKGKKENYKNGCYSTR